MGVIRGLGPFPLSLVTQPSQYGLTDFVVTRYPISTDPDLASSSDISGSVDVDEFVNTVAPFSNVITVTTDQLRGMDKLAVAGDTAGELFVGAVVAIGDTFCKIKAVAIAVDGTGYIDITLPLRADVPAGATVQHAGNTGRYRLTIVENLPVTVQYRVSSPSSIPEVAEDTPVIEVSDTSINAVVVDNSKLIL